MPKRRMPKTVREWGAPELVGQFPKIITNAHISAGRDSKLISEFMLRTGYDPIDVLWLMREYRDNGPRDVRSFIRWASKYRPYDDLMDDYSYEWREVIVAQMLGPTRASMEALTYFDLEGQCHNAQEVAALKYHESCLREYVDPILGARQV